MKKRCAVSRVLIAVLKCEDMMIWKSDVIKSISLLKLKNPSLKPSQCDAKEHMTCPVSRSEKKSWDHWVTCHGVLESLLCDVHFLFPLLALPLPPCCCVWPTELLNSCATSFGVFAASGSVWFMGRKILVISSIFLLRNNLNISNAIATCQTNMKTQGHLYDII